MMQGLEVKLDLWSKGQKLVTTLNIIFWVWLLVHKLEIGKDETFHNFNKNMIWEWLHIKKLAFKKKFAITIC